LLAADPIAIDELGKEGAIDAARRAQIDIFDDCGRRSEANFRRTMSLLFSRSVASRSIIRPSRCSKVSAVTSGWRC
jgi:hypothetical protein